MSSFPGAMAMLSVPSVLVIVLSCDGVLATALAAGTAGTTLQEWSDIHP